MTMLEKIARAICKARGNDPDAGANIFYKSTQLPAQWQTFEKEARAALEAMRDPTPEMVLIFPHAEGRVTYKEVYSAMIDAVLKEK